MHYQCSKLQTFGSHGKWKINLATNIKVKSCHLVTKIFDKSCQLVTKIFENKKKKKTQNKTMNNLLILGPIIKQRNHSQIHKNLPKMNSAW